MEPLLYYYYYEKKDKDFGPNELDFIHFSTSENLDQIIATKG